MVKIKIKKLHKEGKLPTYAHQGDAGLDVYSIENIVLAAGERKVIKTGISCETPKGHVFLFGINQGWRRNLA